MKPSVVFINLPSLPLFDIQARLDDSGELYQTLAMPLGIMYLSSFIKKHNVTGPVRLIDYGLNLKDLPRFDYRNINEYISNLARKSIDFQPDILAFSLIFSSSYHFFNLCIRELKSVWPGAISLVGGAHATNDFRGLLQNVDIDYVMRGEGEVALAEFIDQFSGSREIKVRGVYSRKDLAPAVEFEKTRMVDNLDELPFPDWELINMEEYARAKGRKKSLAGAENSRISSIMTSRGCPFDCTFCSSHTVHGKKIRLRSIKNVMQEARLLYDRYKVNLFIPEDDLFTSPKERLLKMLAEFKSLGIPDLQLQFPNALRVNDLNKEVVDGLIATGMRVVILAIESGSEYVQSQIIKKNVDLKKVKEVVSYLKNQGIIVRCYFILGFPGETKELMNGTIDYARGLGADWCNFIIATPLIGSRMYDQFIERGDIQPDFYAHFDSIFSQRQFDTPEISADELNELAYRANLDVNFLNNINKVTGQYERAISLYKDILESYPFHIIGWYCVMECFRAMGKHRQAEESLAKIVGLIETDARASKMYIKYRDLMPDFNPGISRKEA